MKIPEDIRINLNKEPSNPIHYYSLGLCYEESGHTTEALRCYDRALKLQPDLKEALLSNARVLESIGHYRKAIVTLKKALDLSPNDGAIFNSLAILYDKTDRFAEAAETFKKAILSEPNNTEYYLNLGNMLHRHNLIDEAIACYKSALFCNPLSAEAYNNIAIALKDKHDLSSSFENFSKGLALAPDSPHIHFNYAHALLLAGRLTEGFREHEWRFLKDDYKQYWRCSNKPLWDGRPCRSTILIYAEQGFGDTIQFARYAELVKSKGLKVILQCHKELKGLLSSVEGIHRVITFDETSEEFELQCPLLSLPLVFETEINSILSSPYIHASKLQSKKWEKRLKATGSLKIGIAWAGNPDHRDNKNRSIPLRLLKPLLDLKGVDFYSLQKGSSSSEATNYSEIIDMTGDLSDFEDTAGLIDNLDLIITVDTAVAHLAGAMGKRVWILLPFTPDWRWMLQRHDSPWYPSARLFRQVERGDWIKLIEDIRTELLKMINTYLCLLA